ncbi:MAG: hypothetical protein RSG58_02370 [Eubacterium sp.]
MDHDGGKMDRFIPKVEKRTLLVIAGAVWFFAGFNIMRIGTPDMIKYWTNPIIPLICALLVFGVFFKFIFYKMVNKHSKRILFYGPEKINVFKFFDTKSYLIMIFMITFGVLLRKSGWIPPLYLGTFYTGLGASLIGAGILFFIKFGLSYKRNEV